MNFYKKIVFIKIKRFYIYYRKDTNFTMRKHSICVVDLMIFLPIKNIGKTSRVLTTNVFQYEWVSVLISHVNTSNTGHVSVDREPHSFPVGTPFHEFQRLTPSPDRWTDYDGFSL